MTFSGLKAMLAWGAPPAGMQTDPRGDALRTMGMLVIAFVGLMLFMKHQDKKKQKQREELLNAIKRGDEVVTSGGIVAEVVTVKEKTVVVRSAEAKFEVTKAAISEITRRSGATSAS
jgi:preprotein translocase subunit YajC